MSSKILWGNTIRVSSSLDPDQPDKMLDMTWVQTVGIGFQQTTLAGSQFYSLSVIFLLDFWSNILSDSLVKFTFIGYSCR